MKKVLDYSRDLNIRIRVEAAKRGISANALIVEVLEKEFKGKGK
tara:strand:+ start:622 stop:753 length:132 start_codon:yes stop_codon:yes gene_type:complete